MLHVAERSLPHRHAYPWVGPKARPRTGSGRHPCMDGPLGSRADCAERPAAGTSAIMCPALRCGIDDRGPDGFRERALNTSAASQCAVGCHGVSRSSVRPIAIFCYRPFTQDDERVSQPPAVAGMPRRSSSWPTRHGPSCWPARPPPACAAGAAAAPAAMRWHADSPAWSA